jgi:predicted  nucleic acid-binding Zn-ribbon protein
MEKILLTQEEIDSLKSIQEQNNQLIANFGQLEIAIQSLELQKEQLIEALTALKTKENDMGKTLQDKYGNGNINIETGEFTKIN